jgi:hypothetical protein
MRTQHQVPPVEVPQKKAFPVVKVVKAVKVLSLSSCASLLNKAFEVAKPVKLIKVLSPSSLLNKALAFKVLS